MIRTAIPSVSQLQSAFSKQCAITPSLKTACDVQHVLSASPLYQQVRTTFILRRTNPTRLSKMHKLPRKYKSKDFIYELVENTNCKKPEPLKVLLTTTVEGLGQRGDIVELGPNKARTNFILPGLAVYASPENLEKYKNLLKQEVDEDLASSPFALKTASEIGARVVYVHMNLHNPWKIEPWHVRVAFRRGGVIVPEESLTLPSKPIVGPDITLEGKEFLVKVKINKKEEASARVRIHHYTPNVKESIPLSPENFLYHAEPVFPEEGPMLLELAKTNQLTRFGSEEEEE